MTGRERYEEARRRAQARQPADPQRTSGGPAFPELNQPCGTPGCGHPNCLHQLGTRNGQPAVTWCTIMTGEVPGGRRCPCRQFTQITNPD